MPNLITITSTYPNSLKSKRESTKKENRCFFNHKKIHESIPADTNILTPTFTCAVVELSMTAYFIYFLKKGEKMCVGRS